MRFILHLGAIKRPHVVALHAFLTKPANFFNLHEVAERQFLTFVRVAELLATIHLTCQTAKNKAHVLSVTAGKYHPCPAFRGQPFKQEGVKIANAGFGHAAVVYALPAGAFYSNHAGVGVLGFFCGGGQHAFKINALIRCLWGGAPEIASQVG